MSCRRVKGKIILTLVKAVRRTSFKTTAIRERDRDRAQLCIHQRQWGFLAKGQGEGPVDRKLLRGDIKGGILAKLT